MLPEECKGCNHVRDDGLPFPDSTGELGCSKYTDPSVQWKYGRKCVGRTHNLAITAKGDDKKLNPLKASKRGVKQ